MKLYTYNELPEDLKTTKEIEESFKTDINSWYFIVDGDRVAAMHKVLTRRENQ